MIIMILINMIILMIIIMIIIIILRVTIKICYANGCNIINKIKYIFNIYSSNKYDIIFLVVNI